MMKHNRGSILLATVILIMVLSLVQIAVIYLKTQDEIIARQEVNTSKSYYIAEAGFERMRQWVMGLNNFPENPFPQVTVGYAPWGTVTLGGPGETYLTSIYKDNINSTINKRYYNIKSSGTAVNMLKSITAVIIVSTNNAPPAFIYKFDKFFEEPAKRRPGT